MYHNSLKLPFTSILQGDDKHQRTGDEVIGKYFKVKMLISNKSDRPNVMYRITMLKVPKDIEAVAFPADIMEGMHGNKIIDNDNTEKYTHTGYIRWAYIVLGIRWAYTVLGSTLGALWEHSGSTGEHWGALGSTRRAPGSTLGALGSTLGALGSTHWHWGALWEHSGSTREHSRALWEHSGLVFQGFSRLHTTTVRNRQLRSRRLLRTSHLPSLSRTLRVRLARSCAKEGADVVGEVTGVCILRERQTCVWNHHQGS
jgi:hypothetical protein